MEESQPNDTFTPKNIVIVSTIYILPIVLTKQDLSHFTGHYQCLFNASYEPHQQYNKGSTHFTRKVPESYNTLWSQQKQE